MKKKIAYPKNYIKLDINPIRIRQLDWSQEDISSFTKYYRSLNISDVIKKKNGVDPRLALLRGKKGEVSCIRDDSRRQDRYKYKLTLITEFSLSLTVTEMRNWIQFVTKFFKPYFIHDVEMVKPKGNFEKITKKPYHEFGEVREHYDIRYTKYSDSAPYGTKSGRKKDYSRMCKFIKKRYRELQQDKSLSKYYDRFYKIQDELKNMEFGSIKQPKLSIERIRAIVYSKK